MTEQGVGKQGRRAFLSGVGAATLALTTGCRTGGDNSPTQAAGSAAWSYTDSRGIDVALENSPEGLGRVSKITVGR